MSAQPDSETTSIHVSVEVRDLVRSLKRGHMTYDELLTRMAKQYDPDKAVSQPSDAGER